MKTMQYALQEIIDLKLPLLFVFLYVCSHEGTDSPANSEDVIVIMDSFKAKIVKVKV